MPHLILTGRARFEELPETLEGNLHRWRRAVLKTEATWMRPDGSAMLAEGVVVEFSRPLHPVAVVSGRGDDTVIRLWQRVDVERTDAVQRWLCLIAVELQKIGAGPVRSTNIAEDLWTDLALRVLV